MSDREDSARRAVSWAPRIAFGVMTAAALVLGYVGLSEHLQHTKGYGVSVLDKVYYDLQLFVLGSAPLDNATTLPWTLEVARFAAPAVTIYVVILALQSLLRERWRDLRVRLMRGHTVVCGPPSVVAQLASQIAREPTGPVVVLTEDVPPMRNNLLVLKGDPRSRAMLRRAGVARAREVFALGDDSVTNALVALRVHQIVTAAGGTAKCYAEAPTREVFDAVLRQERRAGEAAVWVEPFTRRDRMASLLVRHRGPELAGAVSGGVIVIGTGGLGDAVIDKLIDGWDGVRHSDGPPRLLIVDADVPDGPAPGRYATERSHVVVTGRHLAPRWIGRLSDLCVPTVDGHSSTVPHLVYVCLPDDAECLAVAHRAAAVLQDFPAVVVALVQQSRRIGEGVLPRSPGADRHAESLVLVNQTQTVFSLAAMRTGLHESLARNIHEAYLRSQAARGLQPGSTPSMVPWEKLPPDLQESNREQAWDIGCKLDVIGVSAVPADSAGARHRRRTLTDAQIETLAELEHERWYSERDRLGWRYAPTRDDSRQLHPDMQPWEKLSPAAKEKDREAVRVIPELLEQVDLAIVPLHP